jgi:hypothetical protein
MSTAVTGLKTAGSTLSIQGTYTAPTGSNGSYIMDVELYNLATGSRVSQWFTSQTFTPGQVRTAAHNWTATPGSYQVRLGIFDANWTFIGWLQEGTIIQVS